MLLRSLRLQLVMFYVATATKGLRRSEMNVGDRQRFTCNVFVFVLILLISCWAVAMSLVAEETNAVVTLCVAEITYYPVFRCDCHC